MAIIELGDRRYIFRNKFIQKDNLWPSTNFKDTQQNIGTKP